MSTIARVLAKRVTNRAVLINLDKGLEYKVLVEQFLPKLQAVCRVKEGEKYVGEQALIELYFMLQKETVGEALPYDSYRILEKAGVLNPGSPRRDPTANMTAAEKSTILSCVVIKPEYKAFDEKFLPKLQAVCRIKEGEKYVGEQALIDLHAILQKEPVGEALSDNSFGILQNAGVLHFMATPKHSTDDMTAAEKSTFLSHVVITANRRVKVKPHVPSTDVSRSCSATARLL